LLLPHLLRLLWRALGALVAAVELLVGLVSSVLRIHTGIAASSWILRWINDLREVPLSSHLLRSGALLWRLRVELLLLHRVVLRVTVDGKLVQAASCLATRRNAL